MATPGTHPLARHVPAGGVDLAEPFSPELLAARDFSGSGCSWGDTT
ncbi:MAG: hypothetical protein ACRDZO_19310 [Egibacteraceae bacterium]